MKPYYQDEYVTLYHGDALQVIASLPDQSVDVVMTDPPYSSGGMMRGDRMQDVHTKYVNSDSVSGAGLHEFTGDNRDQRAYGYWCALWIGELVRVLKTGGIIALFTDWRQLPTTTDALQAGGMVWRGIVPWYKPNGRPVQGRWANSCEYVVWGTNGPRDLDATGGSAFPGFFQALPPRERTHITQKPLSVMQEMLGIAPAGGVVLDPFAGSGTTLVAAKNLGLRGIGVERTEAHVAATAARLSQGVLDFGGAA